MAIGRQNDGQAEKKEGAASVKLAPITNVPPVNMQEIHPYALQRYLEFLQEVHKEVPTLDLLNDEDLQLFLSDEEWAKFKASFDEIKGWLQKCSKDSDEATLMVYPYHSPFDAMWDVKKLLKKVAEGRAERNRREAEEKKRLEALEAEKQRRLAALREIDPPFDDAEKYLTDEEQQQFIASTIGAVDAYLGVSKVAKGYNPHIWQLSPSAADYVIWTGIIAKRKKEETRRRQAGIEYRRFVKEVGDTIKKFQQELAKAKKPKFSYPKWLAGYYPDLWFDLSLPTMEKIEGWAKPKIEQLVPQVLRKFLRYDLDWQVQALPEGKYKECGGVPCLIWSFFILILISARLTLPGGTTAVEFEGYRYEIKLNAVDLGDLYLGPVMGGTVTGGTTPVALMSMLEKGELEGPGIKVVNRGAPFTTFHVQGFQETVVVHDSFRSFMRDISEEKSLAEALLAKGLVDKDTGTLLQEKADLPLPQLVGAETSSGQTSDNNSDLMAALEGMGYKTGESKKAIEAAHLSPGMSLEEMVGAVLKNIGM